LRECPAPASDQVNAVLAEIFMLQLETAARTVKTNEQPTFVVRLRPLPDVDPIRLLCVEAYEEPTPGAPSQTNKSI
jgi:hypothetical protein